MKLLITTAILGGLLGSFYPQFSKADELNPADTVKSPKKHKVSISVNFDDKKVMEIGDTVKSKHAKNSGFSTGLTFSKFDLGFLSLLDNGSFTLSPKNDFLSYNQWKTSTVGFDVYKFGYRFNDHFKMTLAGGFDWNLVRLQKDITILPDQAVLTYRVDNNIHYDKNRFSASYLRIPLYFDFRGNTDKHNNRFHLILSPEAGFLIDGMVKQKSGEFGKKKAWDDYHFTRFRYGAALRFGYGDGGIFVKYYFNDMFENSPAQVGLKTIAFGFTFGLK